MRRSFGEGQPVKALARGCDHGDRHECQDHDADSDHGFGSKGVIRPPPNPRAHRRGKDTGNAKQPELRDRPAKHARRIEPAEAVKPIERVAIEHGCAKIGKERPAPRQAPQGSAKRAEGLSHRLAGHLGRRGPDPEKKRHHEQHIPQRRERTDKARAFALCGIEPKGRFLPKQCDPSVVFGKRQKHDDKRDQAADISQREPRARDAADLRARCETWEHGVGHNRGHFDRDDTDRDRGQNRQEKGAVGNSCPERGQGYDKKDREPPDPGKQIARPVRHCPHHGRGQVR